MLRAGAVGLLVFLVLIVAIFWNASRRTAAPGTRETALTTSHTTAEGDVLLPIVSGGSETTTTVENSSGGTTTPGGYPGPESSSTESSPAGTPTPVSGEQSPGPQSTTQVPSPPNATNLPAPSVTPGTGPTSGSPSASPSPTLTPTDDSGSATLFIRNDRICLDPSSNDLFIYGEISNSTSIAYDILDWELHLFNASGEVPVNYFYFDMPNNFYVFANSSIPFTVYANSSNSDVSDYDLAFDFAPAPHIQRTDLRIDEFVVNQYTEFQEITGRWSHTNVADTPDFVSIIATTYDAQGRVINMDYLPLSNIPATDPNLPAGQHPFSRLYLENNPCGDGTVAITILGE